MHISVAGDADFIQAVEELAVVLDSAEECPYGITEAIFRSVKLTNKLLAMFAIMAIHSFHAEFSKGTPDDDDRIN
jgi:hypothetical protein